MAAARRGPLTLRDLLELGCDSSSDGFRSYPRCLPWSDDALQAPVRLLVEADLRRSPSRSLSSLFNITRISNLAPPPRTPPAASARSPAAWAWPPRARRLPSQQPTERERRGAGGGRSEEEEEGLLRRREARRLPGVDLAELPWEAAWEDRGGGDTGRRRCPGRREAHREARRHCWPATASRAAVAVPDHRPPPAKLELVPTRRRLPAATSPERRGGR